MNDELDYDLTPDQWEMLKALRSPSLPECRLNRLVLESLTTLDLVSTDSGLPVITPRGRHVLIRGSSRLLDLAA